MTKKYIVTAVENVYEFRAGSEAQVIELLNAKPMISESTSTIKEESSLICKISIFSVGILAAFFALWMLYLAAGSDVVNVIFALNK